MSRDTIVRVAHRGASALYPENTRLAFRQAVEQGVDALEVDIHRIPMLGGWYHDQSTGCFEQGSV